MGENSSDLAVLLKRISELERGAHQKEVLFICIVMFGLNYQLPMKLLRNLLAVRLLLLFLKFEKL